MAMIIPAAKFVPRIILFSQSMTILFRKEGSQFGHLHVVVAVVVGWGGGSGGNSLGIEIFVPVQPHF
jgi:hypothetical protein